MTSSFLVCLSFSCLSALLLLPVLAHNDRRKIELRPRYNSSWKCPCPRWLCWPVSVEYRTQSFGFLDLARRPDASIWIALPSLTALIVSHETLDQEPMNVASPNTSLAKLFCRSRLHGVRLLYRLKLEEPLSPALHRLFAVFAQLPFDGVSLRIDDAMLDSPGKAENATRRAIQMVRRLRTGAWVMLEQPSLQCTRCRWMHKLSRKLVNFLYLPTYQDSDCPNSAFTAAADVSKTLAAERSGVANRLVLGSALFALRFDCEGGGGGGGNCTKSAACPSRVVPRDLRQTVRLRRFGQIFQQIEADSREAVMEKVHLARRSKLAGFGLFHANDITANSSAEFWHDIGRFKQVIADEVDHREVVIFFLIFVGLLMLQ